MLGNNVEEFDARIREELGGYVYVLRDPTTKDVFYIGKAGGWDAQGNDRVLAHFAEARSHKVNPSRAPSEKVKRILEIWESGREVDWYVLRRGLRDEAEAFHVEAALIDLLHISSAPDALNAIGGIRGHEHGFLDADGVRRLAAPKLGAGAIPPELARRPILIFNIQNALAQRDSDPYQATRSAWKLGPNVRGMKDAIAIGLAASISRGAWEIEAWERDGDRWCFTGSEVAKDLREHLEPRNFHAVVSHDGVRGYWQRGNPIAIELSVECQFRVQLGAGDRESWHPLTAIEA